MGHLLSLDVVTPKIGDYLGALLSSRITLVLVIVLGLFLIYKGVTAIQRELDKKNGLPGEPPVISGFPDQEEPSDEK